MTYLRADLDKILDVFKFVNLSNSHKKSRLYRDTILSYADLKRIANNHLLTTLTKYFCYADMCVKISMELFGETKVGALISDNDTDYGIEKFMKKLRDGTSRIAVKKKSKS